MVGQSLSIGSRVGWGILVVFCTALDLLLLRLSYHQLGWRQHFWLSCDLRRKHAAEQQQLRHALNVYKTCSRSCMHVLVLSLINGLVLALASNPASSTGVELTGPEDARFLTEQDSTPEERMQQARIGILISVGLTVLPMLWLALAHCAVHYSHGSRRLEEVATATVILSAVCSVVVQFYFLFDPLYAWPAQQLVVRLLLLAAPMAVWMVLLALTCLFFKRVMAILRCASSGRFVQHNQLAGTSARNILTPNKVALRALFVSVNRDTTGHRTLARGWGNMCLCCSILQGAMGNGGCNQGE